MGLEGSGRQAQESSGLSVQIGLDKGGETLKDKKIAHLESLLWHSIHKNHPLSPSACTPCEEIDKALTEYVQRSKAESSVR